MPEFPRHSSQRSLTTQQPRAFRQDADIRSDAADRSKIAGKAIADVTDTMTKWNAAVEKVQYDTAMYNFKSGLQEISNEVVLDPDITAEATYQKKMQDLRKSVTKGIGNTGLVNRMTPELNYLENMGSLGIQQEFRKKTIIHGQKIKLDELSLVAQNPTADGPEQIKAIVDDAVKSGYWDEVKGRQLQKQYTDDLRENMFIQDLNADPATTEKNLMKNNYGFDVDELENAGKIYERELKVIQNQTEENLIEMYVNNTLTEDTIREQLRLGKVSASFAKTQIKALNTVTIPKVEALESVTQQNILAAKYNALKDKEWAWKNASYDDRTQFRADVFQAKHKGWIDQELFEDYLTKSKDKFFSDPVFQNAMKSVFDMSKEYATTEAKAIAQAQMSKDLMRKAGNGMAPLEALDAVLQERIASDFPGVDPVDLVYTAKKRGVKVWQVYELLKGAESAD